MSLHRNKVRALTLRLVLGYLASLLMTIAVMVASICVILFCSRRGGDVGDEKVTFHGKFYYILLLIKC